MRREFLLPEDDTNFLEALNHDWETIVSSGNWVVIKNYPIPEGYNVKEAAIALKIETGYPVSQIDMAYFHPALSRLDGKIIGALTSINIDGKQWQRWSRHRTAINPWRVGIDNVSTQVGLVENWLELEFKKR
jgi:Prokaryotic E2 family E